MKILKSFTAFITLTTLASSVLAATDFKVDPKGSVVQWEAKKVTGAHNGTVRVADGTLNVDKNQLTGGTLNVDMTSLAADDVKDAETNAKLIGHLKSDDFFSTEKHPRATLKITQVSVGAQDKKFTHTITGDLTIKDKTLPVTFPATVKIDGQALSATAELIVDRTLFDIRYRSGKFFQDLGDKLIKDQFTLNVKVSAKH